MSCVLDERPSVLSVGATGPVNIRSTPLLTVDEVDQALALPIKLRGAGQEK
jgi:hypothetical protein